jgi:hypothetical protein
MWQTSKAWCRSASVYNISNSAVVYHHPLSGSPNISSTHHWQTWNTGCSKLDTLCTSVYVFKISSSAHLHSPPPSNPNSPTPSSLHYQQSASTWMKYRLLWYISVFLLDYTQTPLSRPWIHDNIMTMWLQLDNFSVKITFIWSIIINKSRLESITEYCAEQWTKLQWHNCYKMAPN